MGQQFRLVKYCNLPYLIDSTFIISQFIMGSSNAMLYRIYYFFTGCIFAAISHTLVAKHLEPFKGCPILGGSLDLWVSDGFSKSIKVL